MVDEVIPSERVDEVTLAAEVRGGDGDELAVPGRGGQVKRPGQQAVAVGGEQHRRDEDHRVIARPRRLDDRRNRRGIADRQLMNQLLGETERHARSVHGAADTSLTPSRHPRERPYTFAVLRISVLGPVEVSRDGQPLPVPGGKASELLVRLALEDGMFVRTDRLVDDLWHGAVDTRRNTLQSKVTRLRRTFGDPLVIAGGHGGYKLTVEPSQVDALVALRDTAAAARLLDAGDDRSAAELSASTLCLFRGDLLPGAGDGDWAAPHRGRFDEARMKLVEIRLSALLGLNAPGDPVGELEAAVAGYPYQEGLWALLITALYRAGRQADALSAYQRVRALLADELGLDPGPRLQQLERQILQHDPSLRVPDLVASSPEVAAGNLPAMSAELVGREEEIAALAALVADSRLVEIVGPGGSGRRRSRSPPAAGSQSLFGWSDSRPRPRRTRSSMR